MTYVTTNEVATILGRPLADDTETDQVQAWIERVEARIAKRIPDLATRAEDPAYESMLRGVIVDVVARKVQNPTGMKSERVDDYYYDRGAQDPVNLWLTDEEWRELGWVAVAGAFSTRPAFEPDRPAPRPIPVRGFPWI